MLFDAGTTTARVAALLPTDRELAVVTNSVPIAVRLSAMPAVSLQLLGGRVRGLTQAAVGEQALRVLDTLRVDIAFIGTNGISVAHGLSTPDSEEAAVKRAMVAAPIMLSSVADSSKVDREEFVSFAPISSVDALVTDTEITRPGRHRTHRTRSGSGLPSPHDRHRHAEPQHRSDRHPGLAADPGRGAPGRSRCPANPAARV